MRGNKEHKLLRFYCRSRSVLWYFGVWCVELSRGSVGGEKVPSEEEVGRKGQTRIFLKEFFHPLVTYTFSTD